MTRRPAPRPATPAPRPVTWVRFKCGCIGIMGVGVFHGDSDGSPLIVKACDNDEGHLDFFPSGAVEDPKPLPPEEAAGLIDEIRDVIRDGYRLREIRALLRGPQ